MVITRIKYNGRKVRLGGYGFQKYQMLQWGQFAVDTVKLRVARGIGSNDTPMPPLSGQASAVTKNGRFVRQRSGYAQWKPQHGGYPIRDLKLTGKMLNDFSVRYADSAKVRMDITTRMGRIKARANERRAPWFGFSRDDEAAIYEKARTIFKGNIANFGVRLRGVGLPRNPIWMNPGGVAGVSRFGSN